ERGRRCCPRALREPRLQQPGGSARGPGELLLRARAVTLDAPTAEHAPHTALTLPGERAPFHDRCSDLMRELLRELARAPGRPRTFPQIEDAIGWPRRRIASVLGGVSHLRHTEFGG